MEESRSGLVALLIGVGVFLVVAMGVARWWYGQPAEREPPPEKDWVVLPVSSAAKDAGIKPAPRAPAPPPGRGPYGPGRPAPGPYPESQPGYPPQIPGYPPQQWPAQPGYYPPPNYPNPGYGAPPAYPPQGPPAYPPAPQQQPPTPQPGPPAGTRTPGGVPTEPPTGPPAQPAAQHRQPASIGPEEIPDGQAVDEGQVRFHVPPEGTLQLLPGRLDVVGGDPGRGGIRFVKIPREDPEVTFGRSAGPQYRHIQLKIPTVSRMHARMWFQDGVWSIENLSETNPVVVNDQPMGLGSAGSLALKDGDRIEMGEVVFRYWI